MHKHYNISKKGKCPLLPMLAGAPGLYRLGCTELYIIEHRHAEIITNYRWTVPKTKHVRELHDDWNAQSM